MLTGILHEASDICSLIINTELLHHCRECSPFLVAMMSVSCTLILPWQNNNTNVIIDNIYLSVPGYIHMLSIILSWIIQGRLSFPLFTDKIREVKKFTKIAELTGDIVGFKHFGFKSRLSEPSLLSYPLCIPHACLVVQIKLS